MRVVYHIPNDDLRKSQAAAIAAEVSGFDGICALENAHGPIPPLTIAALATRRVELSTGVAIAFPRSPTIMAHAAWDLHKASHGRFHLGLGQSGQRSQRAPIWYRMGAARPADARLCRRCSGRLWHAWQTETPIDYESEHYTLTLSTPNFSPKPNGLNAIPISIAAVGPGMLKDGR